MYVPLGIAAGGIGHSNERNFEMTLGDLEDLIKKAYTLGYTRDNQVAVSEGSRSTLIIHKAQAPFMHYIMMSNRGSETVENT